MGPEFGIKPQTRNVTQDLIDQGTDCLQAMVRVRPRAQDGVLLVDADERHARRRSTARASLFSLSELKYEHPEWLVGDCVKRTPFGRWSSVDYARPEIRDLAFRFIEEVCRGYDVDGVELDFFRHLCYFKSVANGGVSGQAADAS